MVGACSDAACFRLYLYGAISKINKLAGGDVFKLYRIFIAIDGAMILLSFSAKYAPVSTRKVLFFVICDTAMLAFLLWIKIKTRRQAKRPIFRLCGALRGRHPHRCDAKFSPAKSLAQSLSHRNNHTWYLLSVKIYLRIGIVERVCRKSQVRLR